MFTTEERDRVRARLLELAEADPDVVGAAITGSYAVDGGDEWSDIDLSYGIRSELAPALERWTETLDREFASVHHWDLPSGSTIYRVFLLPDWLQVDISFTPAADWGPRGPNWRTVFGETVETPSSQPSRNEFVGWAWVLARHARACLDRKKPWQALWCINSVRDNVLALASLRLGYPARYARGADLLPPEVTEPVRDTLVRSLDYAELQRALAGVNDALAAELERTDPALAANLKPMLSALG
jgi:predicted nucleotidyltransferase